MARFYLSAGWRILLFLLLSALLAGTAFSRGTPAPEENQTGAPPESKRAEPGQTLSTASAAEPKPVQKFEQAGIAVEFSIAPAEEDAEHLLEGEEATVRFRITDSDGTPLSGLYPIAWLDLRPVGVATDPEMCHKKVGSFLQGSLSARPTIDLNTYYVVALNNDSTLTVIDPLLGFSISRLYAMVLLKSPGEDWVLSQDRRWLYVSLPEAGQVAVVDTTTWKLAAYIDAGARPTRLVLQGDEKYLWVGNDAASVPESGVTVIDTGSLQPVAHISTGAGRHQIALDADDRYAFVTNSDEGTLSILDVWELAKVKDLATGSHPVDVAFSPLSRSVYVVQEKEGSVVVVDRDSHRMVARMVGEPGLTTVRFAPGGRWGFVLNTRENLLHIFDSSSNRVAHTMQVDEGPDQVSFTDTFAYIRMRGSDYIKMIELGGLDKPGPVTEFDFPGGQSPPARASAEGIAPAIVPSPHGEEVLFANPADKMIYSYHEGMAAPQGSYRNYGHEPKAVVVVDRNLREAEPGVYATTVQLVAGGNYDVPLLLDSPRLVHCFAAAVKPNPALKREQVALHVEPLLTERKIPVGREFRLQFKASDPNTHQPRTGLEDVRVLILLSGSTWHKREWARPLGEAGLYEVSLSVPRPGVYFVFFECPSLKTRFDQLAHLILQATGEEERPPGEKADAVEGGGR